MKEKEANEFKNRAIEMIKETSIKINNNEIEKCELADFGLDNFQNEGAQIFTFVNTNRIGVKVIVLLPNQTLPEHLHPPIGNDPGKEEILRVIKEPLRVYIPGDNTLSKGFIPDKKEEEYTVLNENILNEGEQIILEPGTKHWFQAGENGSVFFSFSTTVRDGKDIFTDKEVDRGVND
ncbi:MAG TPA: D-lyxose/D-mannose family sugar isomerase [Clostridia bacterium]|nr:D-lyxose/D-mannose family sugar isomerase [Clostridia bacterium]